MTLEGSNFHEMVPNFKWNGMVSIKQSQVVLWILCIILYTYETFFGADDKKRPKLLGNCVQIPSRVMAKLAPQIKYEPPKFNNRVWE